MVRSRKSSHQNSHQNSEKKVEPWYAKGLQFECQGSGQCCVSHGEYGFVYVTLKDRQNLAKLNGLTTAAFTRHYCLKTDGVFHLMDGPADSKGLKPCIFLKNKRCSVYAARPTQCRTWPFWPETMTAKAWTKDVAKFCPGVGKGRVWSKEEIERELSDQSTWEAQLGSN